jgi:hypothetical protein
MLTPTFCKFFEIYSKDIFISTISHSFQFIFMHHKKANYKIVSTLQLGTALLVCGTRKLLRVCDPNHHLPHKGWGTFTPFFCSLHNTKRDERVLTGVYSVACVLHYPGLTLATRAVYNYAAWPLWHPLFLRGCERWAEEVAIATMHSHRQKDVACILWRSHQEPLFVLLCIFCKW